MTNAKAMAVTDVACLHCLAQRLWAFVNFTNALPEVPELISLLGHRPFLLLEQAAQLRFNQKRLVGCRSNMPSLPLLELAVAHTTLPENGPRLLRQIDVPFYYDDSVPDGQNVEQYDWAYVLKEDNRMISFTRGDSVLPRDYGIIVKQVHSPRTQSLMYQVTCCRLSSYLT